jgi:hypothetical protein
MPTPRGRRIPFSGMLDLGHVLGTRRIIRLPGICHTSCRSVDALETSVPQDKYLQQHRTRISIGIRVGIRNTVQILPIEAFCVSFLHNSCKTGLYGIFEHIKSKAWNFAESLESLLSLIYDLIPPTPGAEDHAPAACMIRRLWLFLSCVPLNSSIRLRLVLVILIPDPPWQKEVMLTHVCARNFGHFYRFEEIYVVGFPNVSRLHVRSCLVHELLCVVPYIFDNLKCIY